MELLITQKNNDNLQTYYEYIGDKKLSEIPKEKKAKEISEIIKMLELNYGKNLEDEKIKLYLRLMEEDGYTLQRIKDCFKNLIRYFRFPNFTYADLTNPDFSKKLYTRQDIIASGRSFSEFIYFETPDKRRFYWDTKYGALPKMFKEIKYKNPVIVYIVDPENPRHLATWDIANNPNCPYNYITAEELCELEPKELNERLGCKFYDETSNEIVEKFLEKFVKHF